MTQSDSAECCLQWQDVHSDSDFSALMTVQPSVVFSPDSLNAGMTMMSSPKIVQPELTIHMHQQPNQQYLGHWHPVVHFSVDLLWLSLLSQPKASLSITFPNFVIDKSCLGDGGDGGGVHHFLKMISNILRSRCSNLQYS